MKLLSHKTIKTFVISLLAGATLFMLWWVWAASPETVWKIMTYNESSIEDYKVFPARTLTASTMPFSFTADGDESDIPETITLDGDTRPLEIFLQETDTTAFLMIQDEVLLLERYFQGTDAETPSLAFSISKSFLSILIGAALEDGYLVSVEQPVTDYVPELVGAGFDEVTIRHLLQMTSGMDYVEVEGNPFSLHARFYYTNRLEYELLHLDLAKVPGQEFSYKTGENALLGLILSRALAPQTITQYTQDRLWQPLGMESDGAWNLDHPDGLEKTWCCLSATARDYAKLGRLYLNQGNWNGEQIIPANWIAESTRVDTNDGSIWNYQYQWWLVTEDGGDFTAMGHLGQFVYVNPAKNLIIVRLGTSRGGLEWDEWKTLFSGLAELIQ